MGHNDRQCAVNHPNRTCYKAHGCRCEGCHEANAAYSRNWRRKRSPEGRSWRHTSIAEQYDCTITLDEYRRLQAA